MKFELIVAFSSEFTVVDVAMRSQANFQGSVGVGE